MHIRNVVNDLSPNVIHLTYRNVSADRYLLIVTAAIAKRRRANNKSDAVQTLSDDCIV